MSDNQYEWHPEIVEFVDKVCPHDEWDWSDPESVDRQFQAIMKVSGMYILTELNQIVLNQSKQSLTS